jgi:hypothetical protein
MGRGCGIENLHLVDLEYQEYRHPLGGGRCGSHAAVAARRSDQVAIPHAVEERSDLVALGRRRPAVDGCRAPELARDASQVRIPHPRYITPRRPSSRAFPPGAAVEDLHVTVLDDARRMDHRRRLHVSLRCSPWPSSCEPRGFTNPPHHVPGAFQPSSEKPVASFSDTRKLSVPWSSFRPVGV